jgi:hypothetical protein
MFDTGSNEMFLRQRFLRDYPGMAAAAKKDSNTIPGLTGSTETESLELKEIAGLSRILTETTRTPSESGPC